VILIILNITIVSFLSISL